MYVTGAGEEPFTSYSTTQALQNKSQKFLGKGHLRYIHTAKICAHTVIFEKLSRHVSILKGS